MRAILITKDGIRVVHLNGQDTLAAIRKALGCRVVASGGDPLPNVAAWVDDEGALDAPDVVHTVQWHPEPLAGNILITGIDPLGNTASTPIGVPQVKEWVTATYTRHVIVTTDIEGNDRKEFVAYARDPESARQSLQVPGHRKLVEIVSFEEWESRNGQENSTTAADH